MQRSDQTNFDSLLGRIQPCLFYNKGKIMNYFEKIFNDLVSRADIDSCNDKKLPLVIFAGYLDLPLLICRRLFLSFLEQEVSKSNSEYMSQRDFLEGMYNLYFGSLEKMELLTFKVFDLDGDGKISIDDAILLFKFITFRDHIVENVDDIIFDFFGGVEYLMYEEFISNIKSKNSNLFLFFLIYIQQNQPFDQEAIDFYLSQTQTSAKTKEEEDIDISDNLENQRVKLEGKTRESTNYDEKRLSTASTISTVSQELSQCFKSVFKISSASVKRREASKNLHLTNICNDNLITFCSPPGYSYKDKSKLANLNTTDLSMLNSSKFLSPYYGKGNIGINTGNNFINNNSSISINLTSDFNLREEEDKFDKQSVGLSNNKSASLSENSNLPKIKLFTLSSEGKLVKTKLMLINKDLFNLEKSTDNLTNSNYKLKSIHSLRGNFITFCEETKLQSKAFFPFALLSEYGNTFANLRNIFFSEDKTEITNFVNKLRTVAGWRSLEDFYEVKQSIGKGQFGHVKLGLDKKSNDKVAIKTILKNKLTLKDMHMIREEIDVLKYLKTVEHPNVVKFYDVFEDRQKIYIVTEYLEGGSLQSLLNSEDKLLNQFTIKLLMKQIANCLLFLDHNGIIHRDLKPENILLTQKDGALKVKIIDFGLAHIMGKNELTTEGYGTLVYTAPEILLQKPYGRKVDIWSFGVMLYYINTGKYPFDSNDSNLSSLASKICFEYPSYPRNMEKDLFGLISKCLQKDFRTRFSILDVVESKWFKI